MGTTYKPTVIDGMTSYSGEEIEQVSNHAKEYQITVEPYSAFTAGHVEVYVTVEGSDQWQRIVRSSGLPSNLSLSDPNVIVVEGVMLNKVKLVPVGVDTGKSFKVVVTPIGV